MPPRTRTKSRTDGAGTGKAEGGNGQTNSPLKALRSPGTTKASAPQRKPTARTRSKTASNSLQSIGSGGFGTIFPMDKLLRRLRQQKADVAIVLVGDARQTMAHKDTLAGCAPLSAADQDKLLPAVMPPHMRPNAVVCEPFGDMSKLVVKVMHSDSGDTRKLENAMRELEMMLEVYAAIPAAIREQTTVLPDPLGFVAVQQADGSRTLGVVMPRMDPTPVPQLLLQAMLDPDGRCSFVEAMVDCTSTFLVFLTFAHAAGLVHQDTKLDNMLAVPGQRSYVVSDYGLMHRSNRISHSGTPTLMSPYLDGTMSRHLWERVGYGAEWDDMHVYGRSEESTHGLLSKFRQIDLHSFGASISRLAYQGQKRGAPAENIALCDSIARRMFDGHKDALHVLNEVRALQQRYEQSIGMAGCGVQQAPKKEKQPRKKRQKNPAAASS